MDNNTVALISVCVLMFVTLGWIPILAIGKSIAWIVEAINNHKD